MILFNLKKNSNLAMNIISYLQLFWYYPCFLIGIYSWTMSYQVLYQFNITNKLVSLVKSIIRNPFI